VLKAEVHGFDSRWNHWNFSSTYSFRPHYDPGIDSASKRNEGSRRLVHRADNLTTFMYQFLGSLSSCSPQACRGIAIIQDVSFNNITTVMTPKRTKFGRTCSTHGTKINAHSFLVVHTAAKRPFATCRCT